MTKSEQILKALELDYETLIPNSSFIISPKNFMTDMKIVLVIAGPSKFEMFIWDKDETVKELCEFQIEENIGSIYSYLYEYKIKGCDLKTKQTKHSQQN